MVQVWNCHLSGTISNIIDPNIQENYQDALHVVHIALLCTQASATLRPSMSKVIMFLTNKDPDLPEATQPPFIDAIHLQSDINTSIASIHSKSNTTVASNYSHSSSSTMSMSINNLEQGYLVSKYVPKIHRGKRKGVARRWMPTKIHYCNCLKYY